MLTPDGVTVSRGADSVVRGGGTHTQLDSTRQAHQLVTPITAVSPPPPTYAHTHAPSSPSELAANTKVASQLMPVRMVRTVMEMLRAV